jgi:hypothetical protein
MALADEAVIVHFGRDRNAVRKHLKAHCEAMVMVGSDEALRLQQQFNWRGPRTDEGSRTA